MTQGTELVPVRLVKDFREANTMDQVANKHQKKIAMDVVKNPSKALISGMDQDEAIEILKKKFKFSDYQIYSLMKEAQARVDKVANTPKTHQQRIAMDVVKNPSRAHYAGLDQQEAVDILRNKFDFTQRQIQSLLNQ